MISAVSRRQEEVQCIDTKGVNEGIDWSVAKSRGSEEVGFGDEAAGMVERQHVPEMACT
jgi:hypothetical protein